MYTALYVSNPMPSLVFPLYLVHDIDEIQRRIQAHETGYIDPRWKSKTFAEGALARIIPRCWEFDPAERIDIFELVHFLRKAVEDNKAEEARAKLERHKKNPGMLLSLVKNMDNTTRVEMKSDTNST